jgi:hypothetical protein
MASEGMASPMSLANAVPHDGSKSKKIIAIYDVLFDAAPRYGLDG